MGGCCAGRERCSHLQRAESNAASPPLRALAGRDNVVIMQKFSSFAAIHENDPIFQAAFRRIQPDSIKRKAVFDGFGYVFGGGLHRDEIYTEVTKQ